MSLSCSGTKVVDASFSGFENLSANLCLSIVFFCSILLFLGILSGGPSASCYSVLCLLTCFHLCLRLMRLCLMLCGPGLSFYVGGSFALNCQSQKICFCLSLYCFIYSLSFDF